MTLQNGCFFVNKSCEVTPEQKRIQELEQEVASLKATIVDLLDLVARLRNRKNSNNSSLPPSKDENRPSKPKSLRSSSGKKSGGQSGHEGSSLQMSETPDIILDHKPEICKNCGKVLLFKDAKLVSCRQVIDIPPIIPQYIEHRNYSIVCKCGCGNTAAFPSGINAPISYGPNVEALIAYLFSRQYLPSKRLQEFFCKVCNLPISEGAIYNILNRFVKKSASTYLAIKEFIQKSKTVGADETGIKVNGKQHWGWTWQNEHATYITISDNRGLNTITDNFKTGIPGAVLVHDCYSSHFRTKVKSHQLCLAHLLRELNFLDEIFDHPWPANFRTLLLDAMQLKKTQSRPDHFFPTIKKSVLENRLDELLREEIPPGRKDIEVFQNRMCRYRDYLFTFLYKPDVPPDNNGSERAIRNIKVKQKISGQFKSQNGADCFAILRSIVDTCLKNNQEVLPALRLIARS